MNKKTDIIGIASIIIALIVLIFGDNIYQQINGRSFFENVPAITNRQAETHLPTLQQSTQSTSTLSPTQPVQIQPSPNPLILVTSTSAIQNLEGTVWAGTDSDGDYYVYEFLAGGTLKYTSPSGTFTDGTWEQNGNSIYMEKNKKFSECEGIISGNSMSGNCWNQNGHKWTWTVTRQ